MMKKKQQKGGVYKVPKITVKLTLANWREEYDKFNDSMFNEIYADVENCISNPEGYQEFFKSFSDGIICNNELAWEILSQTILDQFVLQVPKTLKELPKFQEDYKKFIIEDVGINMHPLEVDVTAPRGSELLKVIKVNPNEINPNKNKEE